MISRKLNTHMMELYKKNGANPMGGCLPILLQIPVFFAVYRVLQNAIELKGAEWILWVNDLAIKDPYFILPILMGITMFLHQRITPTTFTDPMQEKIMKFFTSYLYILLCNIPSGSKPFTGLLTIWHLSYNNFTSINFSQKNNMKSKRSRNDQSRSSNTPRSLLQKLRVSCLVRS